MATSADVVGNGVWRGLYTSVYDDDLPPWGTTVTCWGGGGSRSLRPPGRRRRRISIDFRLLMPGILLFPVSPLVWLRSVCIGEVVSYAPPVYRLSHLTTMYNSTIYYVACSTKRGGISFNIFLAISLPPQGKITM